MTRMRVPYLINFGVFTLFSVVMSGCILPIPHWRCRCDGFSGEVTDAQTGKPINNAQITVRYMHGEEFTAKTDVHGFWEIPRKITLHAAAYIGPPVGHSLFPYAPGKDFHTNVIIQADGYETVIWNRWRMIELSKGDMVKNWKLESIYLEPIQK